MRRGFKTEARQLALEVRSELDLGDLDPLDPWRLAQHLDIPVLPLSELQPDSTVCVNHFQHVEPEAFSAVTLFSGTHRLIVRNDAHARPRQVSNVTHEAAHALLQHAPGPVLDGSGCRIWDGEAEAEAEYLAGALLVTDAAALAYARARTPLRVAASQLGVSTQMVRYRINISGAAARVARAAKKRSKRRTR